MTLRSQLIAKGYTQDGDGHWVKPGCVTYSKGCVVADDVMAASRAKTGKRFFNVYLGPVMCGPDDKVAEVDVDASREQILDAIYEVFPSGFWKVYEVDESGNREIRMF